MMLDEEEEAILHELLSLDGCETTTFGLNECAKTEDNEDEKNDDAISHRSFKRKGNAQQEEEDIENEREKEKEEEKGNGNGNGNGKGEGESGVNGNVLHANVKGEWEEGMDPSSNAISNFNCNFNANSSSVVHPLNQLNPWDQNTNRKQKQKQNTKQNTSQNCDSSLPNANYQQCPWTQPQLSIPNNDMIVSLAEREQQQASHIQKVMEIQQKQQQFPQNIQHQQIGTGHALNYGTTSGSRMGTATGTATVPGIDTTHDQQYDQSFDNIAHPLAGTGLGFSHGLFNTEGYSFPNPRLNSTSTSYPYPHESQSQSQSQSQQAAPFPPPFPFPATGQNNSQSAFTPTHLIQNRASKIQQGTGNMKNLLEGMPSVSDHHEHSNNNDNSVLTETKTKAKAKQPNDYCIADTSKDNSIFVFPEFTMKNSNSTSNSSRLLQGVGETKSGGVCDYGASWAFPFPDDCLTAHYHYDAPSNQTHLKANLAAESNLIRRMSNSQIFSAYVSEDVNHNGDKPSSLLKRHYEMTSSLSSSSTASTTTTTTTTTTTSAAVANGHEKNRNWDQYQDQARKQPKLQSKSKANITTKSQATKPPALLVNTIVAPIPGSMSQPATQSPSSPAKSQSHRHAPATSSPSPSPSPGSESQTSKPKRCEKCDKHFETHSEFAAHLLKSHYVNKSGNVYHCPYDGCDKIYTTREGMRLHMSNIHFNGKQHICSHPNCGKGFVRQSDLRLHTMRIHCKSRPYPCTYPNCDKTFACNSELKRHCNSHARKASKAASKACKVSKSSLGEKSSAATQV